MRVPKVAVSLNSEDCMHNFFVGMMIGLCGGIALSGASIAYGVVPQASAEVAKAGELLVLLGVLLGGAMAILACVAALGERLRKKVRRPARAATP